MLRRKLGVLGCPHWGRRSQSCHYPSLFPRRARHKHTLSAGAPRRRTSADAREIAALSTANLNPTPYIGLLLGCPKLPRDTGCWLLVPRLNRFCTWCQQVVSGDEKHIVFECPALQTLRDRYENLFQAPQGDAMTLFMWQSDIIGVALFVDAC